MDEQSFDVWSIHSSPHLADEVLGLGQSAASSAGAMHGPEVGNDALPHAGHHEENRHDHQVERGNSVDEVVPGVGPQQQDVTESGPAQVSDIGVGATVCSGPQEESQVDNQVLHGGSAGHPREVVPEALYDHPWTVGYQAPSIDNTHPWSQPHASLGRGTAISDRQEGNVLSSGFALGRLATTTNRDGHPLPPHRLDEQAPMPRALHHRTDIREAGYVCDAEEHLEAGALHHQPAAIEEYDPAPEAADGAQTVFRGMQETMLPTTTHQLQVLRVALQRAGLQPRHHTEPNFS